MEIVIRTDDKQTTAAPSAPLPPSAGQAPAPLAGEAEAPSAVQVAAAPLAPAQQPGAIDAGAARIPDQAEEPLAHVAAEIPESGEGGVSGATSAGAAPDPMAQTDGES